LKNISVAMGAQGLKHSAGEVDAACRKTRPIDGIPASMLQRLQDDMKLVQSEIEMFTLRHHKRTEGS